MQLKEVREIALVERLGLEAVKSYLRVTTSTDDAFITSLITAAREKAEEVLGRSLIAHTWQVEVTNSTGVIYLPMPPHGEIETVEYLNDDEWEELEASAGDYNLYGLNEFYISVSTAYQIIRVTFTSTAYTSSDVDRIMMELISVWYDHRPDEQMLENRVIEKLGKYKKWQAA